MKHTEKNSILICTLSNSYRDSQGEFCSSLHFLNKSRYYLVASVYISFIASIHGTRVYRSTSIYPAWDLVGAG